MVWESKGVFSLAGDLAILISILLLADKEADSEGMEVMERDIAIEERTELDVMRTFIFLLERVCRRPQPSV